MSDAVSQHGFTAARRGYATDQVDRTLVALTAQRDEAWERLSVLGAGIREMEKRLADIRLSAQDAPEPDYQVLSEQAGKLMAIADAESLAIRESADRAAEDARDEAYEAGQKLAEAGKAYAETTRQDADQAARRTDERTRAEAEKLRAEADSDARTLRDTATAEAAKTRVAAAEAEEQAEAELAKRRRAADEAFAAEEAKADAEEARIAATAEQRLKEAEQHRETVLAQIKQSDAEAQAKADQLIDKARHKAEQMHAASAQERTEFAKRLDEVQEHLDHIKGTLASLTGKRVGAPELDEQPAEQPAEQPVAQPVVEAETAVLAAVPPKPSTAPAEAVPEAETRIIPKIVIVDDGNEYPSSVVRRT